jgi:hypothetical protein
LFAILSTMGWYKEARLRRQSAGSLEPAPCRFPPGIRHSPLWAPSTKEMRIAPVMGGMQFRR